MTRVPANETPPEPARSRPSWLRVSSQRSSPLSSKIRSLAGYLPLPSPGLNVPRHVPSTASRRGSGVGSPLLLVTTISYVGPRGSDEAVAAAGGSVDAAGAVGGSGLGSAGVLSRAGSAGN